MFETLKGIEDASLDALVTIDVIEHLDKDELFGFADGVLRVLDSGGCWVSHQPNAAPPFFGRIRYGDLTYQAASIGRRVR